MPFTFPFPGWYPDDGNAAYGSQGTRQTFQEVNAAAGLPAFAFGGYAHQDAYLYDSEDPSTYFNGSELMPYLQEAIETKAIFVASIAPVHGYAGFTANDTNNLDGMINILSQFVEGGVEVWLRWAHE